MKLSSQNYVACVGFAIMGLLGCVFALQPKLITPLGILSNIKTTQATIAESGTERTSTRSGVTIRAYNFSYTFSVAGQQYSGRGAFDEQPGEFEIIQYDARNPGQHNDPDLTGHAKLDLVIFAVPSVVLLASLIALLIHHRSPTPVPSTRSRRRASPPQQSPPQ